MRKKDNTPDVVGVDTEGRPVLSGLFYMSDTRGLPLPTALAAMNEAGATPSWMHFLEDALAAGWKNKTIISKVSEACYDVYGKEHRDVVVGRIEKLLGEEK